MAKHCETSFSHPWGDSKNIQKVQKHYVRGPTAVFSGWILFETYVNSADVLCDENLGLKHGKQLHGAYFMGATWIKDNWVPGSGENSLENGANDLGNGNDILGMGTNLENGEMNLRIV